MTCMYCPECGSEQLQCIPQVISTESRTALAGINAQQIMQYVVSYALMGATTAKQLRGIRQPLILLVGTVIGGVVGCAVCYLNHHHGNLKEPVQQSSGEIYQCMECGHTFHPRAAL